MFYVICVAPRAMCCTRCQELSEKALGRRVAMYDRVWIIISSNLTQKKLAILESGDPRKSDSAWLGKSLCQMIRCLVVMKILFAVFLVGLLSKSLLCVFYHLILSVLNFFSFLLFIFFLRLGMFRLNPCMRNSMQLITGDVGVIGGWK